MESGNSLLSLAKPYLWMIWCVVWESYVDCITYAEYRAPKSWIAEER
ncbi:MAG: hypothetical protein VB064_00490 [Oscillospiraceae bacterium]|nr:hypothetical protein [Oscillospiraceae bacterium]